MMLKIIYTRPEDGGLSVVHLGEGGRLAYSVTFVSKAGKVVITTDSLTVRPSVVSRVKALLAFKPQPVPPRVPVRVDAFLRRWPVAGATAEWAETEAEFAARLAVDVVAVLLDVPFVDDSGAVHLTLQRRDARLLGLGFTKIPFRIVDESEVPTRTAKRKS